MKKKKRLPVSKLRKTCDTAALGFKTTNELKGSTNFIGQERAVASIQFGIGIEHTGYHIFALGAEGTGKMSIITRYLEEKARVKKIPDDICYLNNFEDPDKPSLVMLQHGQGRKFRDSVNELLESLETEIKRAFESEKYSHEVEEAIKSFQKKQRGVLQNFDEEARKKQCTILETAQGFIIVPFMNNHALNQQEFSALSELQQKAWYKAYEKVQERFSVELKKIQQLRKEQRLKLKEIDTNVLKFSVSHLLEDIIETFSSSVKIKTFLENLFLDIIDNAQAFKAMQLAEIQGAQPGAQVETIAGFLENYRVNLVVDHSKSTGAPVVVETNPTYYNLMGRIEYESQFGTYYTSFMMIKPGSLHRANGGYLVLRASDILTRPFAWEALERALQTSKVSMESPGQEYATVANRYLEPESVPLDIKVVITGDMRMYDLLYSYDNQFKELFKVRADFSQDMPWNKATTHEYAQFIATVCESKKLLPFTARAVGRVIEASSRAVENR